jgi:hypothetical protein
MKTNMTLSGFTGIASEAKGIIWKELTVWSKMIPMTFFVVDVAGKYNALLGRDWIHANNCVPSTLHQCVVQWVSDEVEVVHADDTASVAFADMGEDWMDGEVWCLLGRDLTDFDYISVGRGGFVPVNVKSMIANRLVNGNV